MVGRCRSLNRSGWLKRSGWVNRRGWFRERRGLWWRRRSIEAASAFAAETCIRRIVYPTRRAADSSCFNHLSIGCNLLTVQRAGNDVWFIVARISELRSFWSNRRHGRGLGTLRLTHVARVQMSLCRGRDSRLTENRTTVEAVPDMAWIAASAPSTLHVPRGPRYGA